MKRIFLAAAVLALLIPADRQAEARTDISIDFFYDNLSDGGAWLEVADYGYCWQPTVAVSNRSWRPYTDGYWAYTDVGWTWVSYEDFGWATYHYGRWMRLRGRGWVWVPGRDWGPAWVSWRTGGDYVGWAPLPPRRSDIDVYAEFSPIDSRVDIDFDIGPGYYNFIDVRYIGEPVLRERIFSSEQNVTYITRTVNVTNITYTNSTVYNYGPDYNVMSRYSTRPIQRLSLQRETTVDPATAAQSKSLMKIQGDKLVVAAPRQFQKPAKTIAPKVVKEKIAQAPVERGWEPVADQKAQAELKAKMQKEDPKSVPPPTIHASEKAASPAASAPASPMTSAPPAPSRTTPDKNKKRNEKPSASAAPSVSVPPAMTPIAPPTDRRKDKQNDNGRKATVPPSAGATESAPTAPPKLPKEKAEKRKTETWSMPPPAPMQNSGPPMTTPPPRKPDLEKPMHEAPPEKVPKIKNEPSQERMVPPPSSNVPANPPGKEANAPRKDDGKKQKKNEPATAPSP
jgi:hypothetical protein